jgi:SWI/SNF related-matrix-associated actin-dependent regulator of chromatin subfamily C
VIPLKERPNEQWEQHVPDPNDEAPVVDPANRTPRPDWYSPGGVSDLELTALHEWFDGSAPHRTPEAYVAAREKVLAMAGKLGTRYLTSTMVRRAVPGDVSSLTRLHGFLMAHSLINEDSQNESAPTPAYLLDDKARAAPISWDDDMKDELLVAVVDQSRKSSKRARLSNPTVAAAGAASSAPAALSIDWEEVSQHVGRGVTARDCEREFLALRIVSGSGATAGASTPADRPITPDSSVVSSGDANLNPAVVGEIKSSVTGVTTTTKPSQYDFLQEILDGCDPDLACAVAATALELSAGSLDQAQKAGRAGLLLARAVEAAQAREESVAHLLSEIVDLRMKKLENRLSLLDDVEGMLEAERVALELERRDLYTARCRHWFGGA